MGVIKGNIGAIKPFPGYGDISPQQRGQQEDARRPGVSENDFTFYLNGFT
jgi:hypothetical protein